MNEYVFEVKLRARVRVRAPNEEAAKNVVPSVLSPPGSLELDLANENNAAIGWAAAVTDVDFTQESKPRPFQEPGTEQQPQQRSAPRA
jgi:hypothetical protein